MTLIVCCATEEKIDKVTKAHSIYDTVPVPIFRLGESGTIESLNRPAQTIAGATETTLEELFLDGEALGRLREAIGERRLYPIHGLVVAIDRTKVYAALADSETGILSLMEETEEENRRKQAISQYADLKSEMAALRKQHSETDGLIRNIAHDMRSPLATALSFGELIQDMFGEEIPAEIKEFQGYVSDSISSAISVVEDLLRYSKLDSPGGIHVSLPSLGKELARDFSVRLPDGRLEQEWGVETVLADPVTLFRILSNLVNNSIKFRRPGVSLTIRLKSMAVGNRIRIEAEDNGQGIPADRRKQVFVRLERISQDTEGLGIGLANVHKLVVRLDGEMGILDGIDGGTKVWIQLPINKLEGSRDPTSLMTGAIMAHAKGDVETALQRAEEAVGAKNDNPAHWAILASIY